MEFVPRIVFEIQGRRNRIDNGPFAFPRCRHDAERHERVGVKPAREYLLAGSKRQSFSRSCPSQFETKPICQHTAHGKTERRSKGIPAKVLRDPDA